MPTSIRFGAETEQRLSHLAAATGRTKAYYIRQAVEEKLASLEDIYLALQRLETPEREWTQEALERGEDLEN